ncbi:hypothetical protein HPB52_003452 [Rhipicephalus sanguineus]|uniref:HMG box domain-containing protein n=1 Tax=Rhipicephalus sanguineus TaxID=34632 RepID=A0A9D4ST77_RHISA|nr:hypothetical protein HPB52_003452 [Rhipicephalus sanguineus]
MSEEDKRPYVERQNEEKMKYEQNMEEYRRKGGGTRDQQQHDNGGDSESGEDTFHGNQSHSNPPSGGSTPSPGGGGATTHSEHTDESQQGAAPPTSSASAVASERSNCGRPAVVGVTPVAGTPAGLAGLPALSGQLRHHFGRFWRRTARGARGRLDCGGTLPAWKCGHLLAGPPARTVQLDLSTGRPRGERRSGAHRMQLVVSSVGPPLTPLDSKEGPRCESRSMPPCAASRAGSALLVCQLLDWVALVPAWVVKCTSCVDQTGDLCLPSL